jgi:magnesium chelatase subunit I
LTKVKNDFAKNKTFKVSQTIVGGGGGGGKRVDSDYESQLSKFPALKELVNETIAILEEEQKQLVEHAMQLGIRAEYISLSQDLNGEFPASVTEVILEGLRHTQPPLLDKKDNNIYDLA